MNRKKLMSKIITAVIAGGVLFSTGTLAFAASSSNSSTDTTVKKQEGRMNMKNPADMMKSELDKLVTAGTITADQETTILNNAKQEQTARQAEMDKTKNMTDAERKAYFESKKTTEKTDFLSTLVTAGTLTQTQADAISAVVHQGPGGQRQPGENSDQAKTELDKLVTAGTLTADQETAILNSIKQEQTGRQAEMEKVKNMTEAERKTYFEIKKTTEKADSLSTLVTAGTLTQTQADAVKNVIHQGPGGMGDRRDGGQSSEGMKTQLDTLVSAGTITQTEETNILNYFTEKQTERKAEMDKVKDMTEADRKAYFESKKTTEKTDMFSELVTAGIITQEKADAIKAAMPAPKVPAAAPQNTTSNQ